MASVYTGAFYASGQETDRGYSRAAGAAWGNGARKTLTTNASCYHYCGGRVVQQNQSVDRLTDRRHSAPPMNQPTNINAPCWSSHSTRRQSYIFDEIKSA